MLFDLQLSFEISRIHFNKIVHCYLFANASVFLYVHQLAASLCLERLQPLLKVLHFRVPTTAQLLPQLSGAQVAASRSSYLAESGHLRLHGLLDDVLNGIRCCG